MKIIRTSDRTVVETPGGNASAAIATPSHGAREVSVIAQRMAPGGQNPLHRHDREEVLLVREGVVTVTVEGESAELAAGDAVVVPAGALHQLRNAGAVHAEWVLVAPHGVRFVGADGTEMQPAWAK